MLMKEIRLLQQQMLITTNPLWSSALAKVKCNRFEKEWVNQLVDGEAIFPLLTTFRKGSLTGTSSEKGDIDKIIIINIK